MKKFDDISKHLIQAIMNDYRESPYDHFADYWEDMWRYYLDVFSKDCYNEISEEIDKILN